MDFRPRLLIPGIYGMKNVKWLNGISIVNNDFLGFWQSQGWDDAAPYQTESRIDVPADATRLQRANCRSAGWRSLATAAFRLSEVSTDAGPDVAVSAGEKLVCLRTRGNCGAPTLPSTVRSRVSASSADRPPGPPTDARVEPPFPSGATGISQRDYRRRLSGGDSFEALRLGFVDPLRIADVFLHQFLGVDDA